MKVNFIKLLCKIYFFSLIYSFFLFKARLIVKTYSTVEELLVLLQLKLFNLHNKYTLLMITLITSY